MQHHASAGLLAVALTQDVEDGQQVARALTAGGRLRLGHQQGYWHCLRPNLRVQPGRQCCMDVPRQLISGDLAPTCAVTQHLIEWHTVRHSQQQGITGMDCKRLAHDASTEEGIRHAQGSGMHQAADGVLP